jgi:hypothetical protein
MPGTLWKWSTYTHCERDVGNWGRVRIYAHSGRMLTEWHGARNRPRYLNFYVYINIYIFFFRERVWLNSRRLNARMMRLHCVYVWKTLCCWSCKNSGIKST